MHADMLFVSHFSSKLEASLIDIESYWTISNRKRDGLTDRYCINLCERSLTLYTHVHGDGVSWVSRNLYINSV